MNKIDINSRFVQSALVFAVFSIVTAIALAILQRIDSNIFFSGGGNILYTAPGTLTALCATSLLGYLLIGGKKKEKVEPIPRTSEPREIDVQSIIKNHEAFKLNPLQERAIALDTAALCKRFLLVKEKCTDCSETAKALEIPLNALQELFDYFEFPETSRNDKGCLHAFFVLLKVMHRQKPSKRDSSHYFTFGHPLWPESKAPNKHPLTVKEFADFLHQPEDWLLEDLKKLGVELTEEKLTCKQMKDFCENNPDFPAFSDMWLIANNFDSEAFWTQERQLQWDPKLAPLKFN